MVFLWFSYGFPMVTRPGFHKQSPIPRPSSRLGENGLEATPVPLEFPCGPLDLRHLLPAPQATDARLAPWMTVGTFQQGGTGSQINSWESWETHFKSFVMFCWWFSARFQELPGALFSMEKCIWMISGVNWSYKQVKVSPWLTGRLVVLVCGLEPSLLHYDSALKSKPIDNLCWWNLSIYIYVSLNHQTLLL